MKKIIRKKKSIIPACDVSLEMYEEIVRDTAEIDGIGGYKIGFLLGLSYGLPKIVEIARKYTDKPLIYDHQKAGTDIPETGKKFADACEKSGMDAVILFPQSGPETERAWIESALEKDLGVIVGGLMTHSGYLKSEGGYIDDDAIIKMYLNAADLGIRDFVVPGNRPEFIRNLKRELNSREMSPVFYAPGFLAQGGKISETAKEAGKNWHAIIGRGIYEAEDKKQAAEKLIAELK